MERKIHLTINTSAKNLKSKKNLNIVKCVLDREYGIRNKKFYEINLMKNFAESTASQPFVERNCAVSKKTKSIIIMEFNHDGSKLATGHIDHTVQVTDVDSGKCLNILKGHLRTPWCLAFHPSFPDILASGCLAGEVRIWDLKSEGHELWQCRMGYTICSMTFHPLDMVLVFASSNWLYFWDWTCAVPFEHCRTHKVEKIRWVKFDKTGQTLYTGISNGNRSTEFNSNEQSNDLSSSNFYRLYGNEPPSRFLRYWRHPRSSIFNRLNRPRNDQATLDNFTRHIVELTNNSNTRINRLLNRLNSIHNIRFNDQETQTMFNTNQGTQTTVDNETANDSHNQEDAINNNDDVLRNDVMNDVSIDFDDVRNAFNIDDIVEETDMEDNLDNFMGQSENLENYPETNDHFDSYDIPNEYYNDGDEASGADYEYEDADMMNEMVDSSNDSRTNQEDNLNIEAPSLNLSFPLESSSNAQHVNYSNDLTSIDFNPIIRIEPFDNSARQNNPVISITSNDQTENQYCMLNNPSIINNTNVITHSEAQLKNNVVLNNFTYSDLHKQDNTINKDDDCSLGHNNFVNYSSSDNSNNSAYLNNENVNSLNNTIKNNTYSSDLNCNSNTEDLQSKNVDSKNLNFEVNKVGSSKEIAKDIQFTIPTIEINCSVSVDTCSLKEAKNNSNENISLNLKDNDSNRNNSNSTRNTVINMIDHTSRDYNRNINIDLITTLEDNEAGTSGSNSVNTIIVEGFPNTSLNLENMADHSQNIPAAPINLQLSSDSEYRVSPLNLTSTNTPNIGTNTQLWEVNIGGVSESSQLSTSINSIVNNWFSFTQSTQRILLANGRYLTFPTIDNHVPELENDEIQINTLSNPDASQSLAYDIGNADNTIASTDRLFWDSGSVTLRDEITTERFDNTIIVPSVSNSITRENYNARDVPTDQPYNRNIIPVRRRRLAEISPSLWDFPELEPEPELDMEDPISSRLNDHNTSTRNMNLAIRPISSIWENTARNGEENASNEQNYSSNGNSLPEIPFGEVGRSARTDIWRRNGRYHNRFRPLREESESLDGSGVTPGPAPLSDLVQLLRPDRQRVERQRTERQRRSPVLRLHRLRNRLRVAALGQISSPDSSSEEDADATREAQNILIRDMHNYTSDDAHNYALSPNFLARQARHRLERLFTIRNNNYSTNRAPSTQHLPQIFSQRDDYYLSGAQDLSLNVTYRIQAWDFSQCKLPNLVNNTQNIVASNVRLHNDATVDISQDGSIICCVTVEGNERELLSVISLCSHNRGQVLYSKILSDFPVSLSLSPLNHYILIGVSPNKFRWSDRSLPKVVGHVIQIQENESDSQPFKYICDIVRTCSASNSSVNGAKWIPSSGKGLAYCTNHGDLIIHIPGRDSSKVQCSTIRSQIEGINPRNRRNYQDFLEVEWPSYTEYLRRSDFMSII